MILIICTDDPNLELVARNTVMRYPDIYEASYKIFHSQLRSLKKSENLFIISHGAFQGDNDRPVIGDKAKAFYLNGDALYKSIKDIIPEDYRGDIYIDACESADSTEDLISFADTFYLEFHQDYPTSGVYGITGVSHGLIPLPSDSKWVAVDLER